MISKGEVEVKDEKGQVRLDLGTMDDDFGGVSDDALLIKELLHFLLVLSCQHDDLVRRGPFLVLQRPTATVVLLFQ